MGGARVQTAAAVNSDSVQQCRMCVHQNSFLKEQQPQRWNVTRIWSRNFSAAALGSVGGPCTVLRNRSTY